MKTIKFGIITWLLSGIFGSTMVYGQKIQSNNQKFNRFGVGLFAAHMYDLKFQSYDDLQNGFSGEDMVGLNGDKTNFDMAYGLDLSYQFSPILGVDMYGMLGSISGANQIEYYLSQFRSLGIGANVSLKTNKTHTYRFVPYVRFATGWSSFDATRYFILDDVSFSSEAGNTWHYNLGIGLNAHITNNWSMYVQSVFNVVATDAWDGYNYGSGRDHMLQTSFGLRYTFGSKKNLHINRSAAWQGVTSKDFLETQDRLVKGLKSVSDKVNDLEEQQLLYQKQTDSALEVIKTDLNPDSLLLMIESQIKQFQAQLANEEFWAIYFDFNKSIISNQGQAVLQDVTKLLNANEGWKVSISAFNDPVGDEFSNQIVRDARREAVKQGLVNLGISIDRIVFKEWEGIYTGNNQIDRRAEIRILK